MKKSIFTLSLIFTALLSFNSTYAQEEKAVAIGGAEISFDKENTVWHNDDSYVEFNNQTLKKDAINEHFGMNMSGDDSFIHPEFEKEVGLCL